MLTDPFFLVLKKSAYFLSESTIFSSGSFQREGPQVPTQTREGTRNKLKRVSNSDDATEIATNEIRNYPFQKFFAKFIPLNATYI